MNSEILNYIDTLHRTHLDNAKTCYQAARGQRAATSISPITNLVFELFLFNSLYSIDWEASIRDDTLTPFDTGKDGPSETQKQRSYLKFCRQRCKEASGSILAHSFSALSGYLNANSDSNWTLITPDARITAELGEKFFRDIRFLASGAAESRLGATKDTFGRIESCTYFLYLIRNNIFHGQKKLGEIYDPDLLQRLSIYDLYIRCLNSLFFLSMGKQEYGSAYAQFPIRVENYEAKAIAFTASDVAQLVYADQMLKPEDAYLHGRLFESTEVTKPLGAPHGALFYPSAGSDLLFPLLLGLPHCDEFHFFDQSPRYKHEYKHRVAARALKHLKVRSPDFTVHDEGAVTLLQFELFGVRRRIYLRRQDNLDFLESGAPLRFYFHRGDSTGEGGSNQQWDSSLLKKLLAMSDDRGLLVLTDGQPGGVLDEYASSLHQINPPVSHRNRAYYAGLIRE